MADPAHEPPEDDAAPAEVTPAPDRASRLGRFGDQVNQPLPSTVIGALLTTLILLVVGALIGLFNGDDLVSAPNRRTKIERLGDLKGPTHVRIVKQKGVVNSYVVSNRVAHHIQTPDI